MTTYIDLHVLQSVPPSNLNRDDMGSPKTATFGGVRRARISSQAWKRATRLKFNEHLDPSEVGYRTTHLVELVANRVQQLDESIDRTRAEKMGSQALKAIGLTPKAARVNKKDPDAVPAPDRTEYMVFLSAGQIDLLAQLAVAAGDGAIDKKAAKHAAQSDHSIDVALFGRMVADDATLNVDAAVQVAHALSTHAVDTEFDYYTAVDDMNPREDTGAGMIGTIEFNSATLYRYATINVDMLQRNLGSAKAAGRAASAFVDAFVRSMPSGKQNTFANGTLPDAVVAIVRNDQPISLSGAFENAVGSTANGWVGESARRLADHALAVDAAYGDGRREAWVTALPACAGHLDDLGDRVPLADLVSAVGSVAGRDDA